jgi:putative cardiolipin synthase
MGCTNNSNAATVIRITALVVAALVNACATVDFDAPKEDTRALSHVTDTADTYLGKLITPRLKDHPAGESGFYFQFDGIDALAARLVLTEKAELSIDAQYYLISNDQVGQLFIRSLLDAADRGVRVRLLLDDIQTQGYDAGMAALDSHPNFTIRIFNPFSGRGSRIGDGLTDFGRINRRMHNKSFTIDNHLTIIGGRNIADEYFGARKDVNFGDADVLGIGPIAQDVSNMFDTYWNSKYAAPVEIFADLPDDPAAALEQLRAKLEQNLQEVKATQYGEAVIADANKYINKTSGAQFNWAPYQLATDSPDKADKDLAADAQKITTTLAKVVAEGTKELIVISPYFVPQSSGLEYFQGLMDRGLKVTVITNSLAANNHGVVHSGYMGSRKALLKMGVTLYEVRSTATLTGVDRGGAGASLSTLHTKAFMVDRSSIFFGSFNWDPRSIDINTELGVVIESPEMGERLGKMIDEGIGKRAYKVVLDDKWNLQWIDNSGEETVVLTTEPDTTWWRRTKAQLGRILPIRGQL